jgi:hypothetical protein
VQPRKGFEHGVHLHDEAGGSVFGAQAILKVCILDRCGLGQAGAAWDGRDDPIVQALDAAGDRLTRRATN